MRDQINSGKSAEMLYKQLYAEVVGAYIFQFIGSVDIIVENGYYSLFSLTWVAIHWSNRE